ncbi:MAG: UDP-N-acetylglucosamine--N-acetylmuramyl-(pentapeptide) pyrophosphoryl-undecaprenol [Limisphaerales bacterium]|nr:MAG: UDP-N-acetylglucosamine--N-acetylmuramyl-(pentapeptide) pyrophosphoryl-undecaprenol [Limisphaerales bacterium]KAG0506631.1 MAG: UDP-N-acetylglucosamine--N-acetylmuramyl-(pentapeptide) pyrophosphoryl-undecaprenol N-acetylglucosamine transferase [Limisphaerales bacterium]TXT44456.1 MAG: UDP-N-acetylglucosamine--N-acetylmuramyl-(pentapeptide) pyrophosphoryl-undecaprenol N-acetylglucosamine transferase [Limisphaerales bacterium]
MQPAPEKPLVAIACGGTGGHLFPGLAVAGELQRRDCDVLLVVSPKEVDQQAVRAARELQVATLPAVALQGNLIAFVRASFASYQAAKKLFASRSPRAVLAMGGFTSAPPVLAGKKFGAKTFLHESNTIPGRANRWLAHFVDEAFVGFPQAAQRLWIQRHAVTGTPVREQFAPADAASCRMALGLDAKRPTLVITGGSQGASGLNDLVLAALPELTNHHPDLQFLHLTGANEVDKARAAYAAPSSGAQVSNLRDTSKSEHAGWTPALRTLVQPFLTEMELALGAATLVVSRAGASSLAELAAMRVPAILVPLPTSADNHQYFNARAFADTGAARMLNQRATLPAQFVALVSDLLTNAAARGRMQAALAQWHQPTAAADIAERILRTCGLPITVNDPAEAEWQPPARFAKSVKPRTHETRLDTASPLQSAIGNRQSAMP